MSSLRLLVLLLPLLSHSSPTPHKRKVRRNNCKPTSSSLSNINLVASPPTSSSVSDTPTSLAAVGVTSDSTIRPVTASSASGTDASSASKEGSEASSIVPVVYTNPLQTSTTASSTSSVGAGIGWAPQEGDSAPIAQFFTPESGVKWWFNWAKNWNQGVMQSDGVQIDGQFIPMLFDSVTLASDIPLEDGMTELMGYNEPDLKDKAVAAYLEPKKAAELWKPQITQIREQYPSIKVHSPVVASNTTWLKAFFEGICPDNTAEEAWGDCAYKPDYVSQHVYSTNAGHFRGAVQQYYKTFGLPIVLSEWACHDWSEDGHKATVDEVSEFMEETMGWLDEQDYVVKYAWFGTARSADHLHGVSETNRLMDENGNITPLYVSLSHIQRPARSG
ncbi:hypothetical protein I316_02030 [Kwoniella heveanensis BCC8398]|uniref:Asl1-like glycosyl hydrolase catalytic domain-containing protein n=1 Tax=Kwoniella heveanensis BCC8398 TaxID=1296120 RepID=A0A1B9GYP5_9TREE|nr:hypothetical protein I316_02030 [Kwoniella heveanensis BCC8398]